MTLSKISAPVIHLLSVFPGIDGVQKIVMEQDLAWKQAGYVDFFEHEDGSSATSETITNGHRYHNWFQLATSMTNRGKRFFYC